MEIKQILDVKKVFLNTGNILSLNDITKKPGQNPTEELLEAMKITLNDYQSNGLPSSEIPQQLTISRSNDDLSKKMSEHELSELKIGLKLFLNSDDQENLKDALDNAFRSLNVGAVHNVIISYNHKDDKTDSIEQLRNIWNILEEYTRNKQIIQIGLSDVDENVFINIYKWANVKPSIIQINLATCCVVPPSLQAFCKENEVQLLTHSDPAEILPEESLSSILGTKFALNWVVRFLVHIKCRGVLATKGYLVSSNKQ